jgi:MSHA biogenesis protein MshI
MRQQINLYQRARRVQMPVSAHSLLVASSALLAVLLSIWAYGQFAVTHLQQQVNLLQQQQQAQTNLVNTARTLVSEKIDWATLQQQVVQLKQSLQDRQQALSLLRKRPPTLQQGFALRLQALAHPHIDGVWLEGVALNTQPGIQSLTGRSLNPALVAGYLRALSSEPALTGTRFTDVRILGPKYVDPADINAVSAETSTPVIPSFTGVRFRVDNHLDTAALTRTAAGNAT